MTTWRLGHETRAELLRAWEDWDQLPAEERRAGRLEAACRCAANELGWDVNTLRRQLTCCRREGLGYEAALARVEGLPVRARPESSPTVHNEQTGTAWQ